MSAFGFLVRWGSMGVGLVMLVGGVQAWATFAFRDEKAAALSVPEALADASAERFVAVDCSIDPTTRCYESFLNSPRFVRADTNQVHTLRASKGPARRDLVGATVGLDSALLEGRIECQVVATTGTDETLQSMRVLSPAEGTGGMTWVLSPRLSTSGDADAWQARGSYQGALSRFDDLSTNVPELGHSAREIRDYALANFGMEISHEATIIIDGQGYREGGAPPDCYAAVVGSEGNLIVRWGSEQPPTGPFTGMLAPVAPWMSDVSALVGASRPAEARLLDTTTSAAIENARDVRTIQVGLVGGLILFAFGGSTTYLKHKFRTARRRSNRAAMDAFSPQQAMALGIPMPGPMARNPYQHTPMPALPRPEPQANLGIGPSIPAGPSMQQPALSPEDAALEAEMARWTSGGNGPDGLGDARRVA